MRQFIVICSILVLSMVFVGPGHSQISIEGDKAQVHNTNGEIVGGDKVTTTTTIGIENSPDAQASIGNIVTAGGDAQQNQTQTQDNSQSQENSQNNSQELTLVQEYEQLVQGVGTYSSEYLRAAPHPSEKWIWKGLGPDIKAYEGEYSLKEAKSMVDSAGIWFVRDAMQVTVSLKGKYKKTNLLDLSFSSPPPAGYERIGTVNLTVKEVTLLVNVDRITASICLGRAMEVSINKGADYIFIDAGMNTVHEAGSAGLSATNISASENGSFSFGGLFGSASLKKDGEPGNIAILYKKL